MEESSACRALVVRGLQRLLKYGILGSCLTLSKAVLAALCYHL